MSGPILLFGLPRSGTTWLGKIFDSHPDTLYRHEPDSERRLTMPLFPDVGQSERYAPEIAAFMSALPGMRLPKVVGKQPIFPKRYVSPSALLAYRAGAVLSQLGGRRAHRRTVAFAPTAAGYPGRRVVWKSIESLGRLGVCVRALPAARAIFILRHPCGYVASVQRGEAGNQFTDATAASEDYGILMQLLGTEPARTHGLTLQDFHGMRPEERLAWRWLLTCEKTWGETAHLGGVLLMRYEDVCADPIGRTAQMFEFAGLDMNKQTSDFIQATTSRRNDGYYSIYRNPAASASRWKTELPPDVINRIFDVLRQSRIGALYTSGIREAREA